MPRTTMTYIHTFIHLNTSPYISIHPYLHRYSTHSMAFISWIHTTTCLKRMFFAFACHLVHSCTCIFYDYVLLYYYHYYSYISCIPIAYGHYIDWSFLLGFLKWIRLQTLKDIKTDLWWTPEEGGGPVSSVGPMFFRCGCWREWSWVIIVPDLKPWQVVWSDWCVTPAYCIWNGDDSTVTVWWHCDCFIGICMGLFELLKTCLWREGTEQLCHLLRQLPFQSICKTCITEVSCGKTVSRLNKNMPRISRIC